MSNVSWAPRAMALLGVGLLGTGCSDIAKGVFKLDASQHVPVTNPTDTRWACPAPAPAAPAPAGAGRYPLVAAAPAAPAVMGPLDGFYLGTGRRSVVAAAAAGRMMPAAAAAPGAGGSSKTVLDTSNIPGAMQNLPPSLQNDKVLKSALHLVAARQLHMKAAMAENTPASELQQYVPAATAAAAAAAPAAPAAGGAASQQESNKKQLVADLQKSADDHKPEPITIDDVQNLHKSLISAIADRGMNYVSYYFDGLMTDRVGNTLGKPTFTDMKVTNADITGVLAALLESLADDAFDSPVWASGTGDKTMYYPGGSKDVPAALRYLANNKEAEFAKNAKPMATSGCGMTELKAQALRYASNNAGVWAGSGTGIVMGLFGGVEIGPFVAFGKVSIGDNQMLQAIVQTVLTFTARRAVYEAALPRLYAHNQTENDRLELLVKVLTLTAPADDKSSAGKTAAK